MLRVSLRCKAANLRFVLLLTQLQLNLRSYNEELRQHLIEARKELEQNNRELSLKKQVFIIKESSAKCISPLGMGIVENGGNMSEV